MRRIEFSSSFRSRRIRRKDEFRSTFLGLRPLQSGQRQAHAPRTLRRTGALVEAPVQAIREPLVAGLGIIVIEAWWLNAEGGAGRERCRDLSGASVPASLRRTYLLLRWMRAVIGRVPSVSHAHGWSELLSRARDPRSGHRKCHPSRANESIAVNWLLARHSVEGALTRCRRAAEIRNFGFLLGGSR